MFKQLSELKVLLHLAAPLGAGSSAQGRVASYCSQGTGLIFFLWWNLVFPGALALGISGPILSLVLHIPLGSARLEGLFSPLNFEDFPVLFYSLRIGYVVPFPT